MRHSWTNEEYDHLTSTMKVALTVVEPFVLAESDEELRPYRYFDGTEYSAHGLTLPQIEERLSQLSKVEISKALEILLDEAVLKPFDGRARFSRDGREFVEIHRVYTPTREPVGSVLRDIYAITHRIA